MKNILTLVFTFFSSIFFGQANAYDIIICNSNDGINWTNNSLFQDSSGVPSIMQHTTGVIYCAFQWFPAPQSPTNTAHDKIAVKQSSDGGMTWSSPVLANFTGFPPNFKRPFDPTIVLTDNNMIRMYFSSSKNGTLTSLDSTVHCYSAVSSDGVNYTFEGGVRVFVKDSITIDPAVAKLGSVWHYSCPRAAPQHGAHHFISNDGLAWTRTTTIGSDMNHNWTGNMLTEGSTLNFYGTPNPQTNAIWRKQTNDGYTWGPYVNCVGPVTANGIQADPGVLKTGSDYIMVYCSKQSLLGINETSLLQLNVSIYPNPGSGLVNIKTNEKITGIKVFDTSGKLIHSQNNSSNTIGSSLPPGFYSLEIGTEKGKVTRKIIIE